MSVALQLMKKKNHQAIAEAGIEITMEQLALLETLHICGDMNMTELARSVWKQNANITRMVDKLEKRQLVMRKPVDGDRRAHLLCITAAGSQLFKKTMPIVVKSYKEITSCISTAEEEVLLSGLKKIITHLS